MTWKVDEKRENRQVCVYIQCVSLFIGVNRRIIGIQQKLQFVDRRQMTTDVRSERLDKRVNEWRLALLTLGTPLVLFLKVNFLFQTIRLRLSNSVFLSMCHLFRSFTLSLYAYVCVLSKEAAVFSMSVREVWRKIETLGVNLVTLCSRSRCALYVFAANWCSHWVSLSVWFILFLFHISIRCVRKLCCSNAHRVYFSM